MRGLAFALLALLARVVSPKALVLQNSYDAADAGHSSEHERGVAERVSRH
jgi:hypothetical protein